MAAHNGDSEEYQGDTAQTMDQQQAGHFARCRTQLPRIAVFERRNLDMHVFGGAEQRFNLLAVRSAPLISAWSRSPTWPAP